MALFYMYMSAYTYILCGTTSANMLMTFYSVKQLIPVHLYLIISSNLDKYGKISHQNEGCCKCNSVTEKIIRTQIKIVKWQIIIIPAKLTLLFSMIAKLLPCLYSIYICLKMPRRAFQYWPQKSEWQSYVMTLETCFLNGNCYIGLLD